MKFTPSTFWSGKKEFRIFDNHHKDWIELEELKKPNADPKTLDPYEVIGYYRKLPVTEKTRRAHEAGIHQTKDNPAVSGCHRKPCKKYLLKDENSRDYAAKENKGFEIMAGEFGWSEFEKPLGKPALGRNALKS